MTKLINQRVRAGTYSVFERRYGPIETASGEVLRDWMDIPPDTNARYIWTALDCDGKLYLVPGYSVVNCFARVLCAKPWGNNETFNTGYLY